MRRPSVFLSWLVLLTLVGGHWFALKTVAWTSMIVQFSTELTVSCAVAKTFSGEAPCQLCHAVADGMSPITPTPNPNQNERIAKLLQCDAVIHAMAFQPKQSSHMCSWMVASLKPPAPITLPPLQRPPIG